MRDPVQGVFIQHLSFFPLRVFTAPIATQNSVTAKFSSVWTMALAKGVVTVCVCSSLLVRQEEGTRENKAVGKADELKRGEQSHFCLRVKGHSLMTIWYVVIIFRPISDHVYGKALSVSVALLN